MTAHEQGRQAGRKWAMSLRGDAGLRALADLEAWPQGCRRAGRSPWGHSERLGALLATGRVASDPEGARTFWLGALGEEGLGRQRDPEFLRGFVEEALRVWSQLKRHALQQAKGQKKGGS